MWRQPDPSLPRAFEGGLAVGLIAVCRLNRMIRKASPKVAKLSSLHRGWGAGKLFEDGAVAEAVKDTVAQEDGTALVLSTWAALC